MSGHEAVKGLEIITQLLELTRKMAKSGDPNFLVEAIDRRGELMAEYDALKASSPEAAKIMEKSKADSSSMINEIIELDKKINKTLLSLYNESKNDLQSSNKNKKILNYTNQAISASGSYMDYKE